MNRIAICDDEIPSQNLLLGLIQQLPFKVSCACFSSGEQLLRACQHGNIFDLVLMDIQIGETMDGIETARRVKELLPEAILVFASGYPKHITKALYVKPDQFLLKPVTYDALLDVILRTIREKEHVNARKKFHFQSKGSNIALYPEQIYYMESMGHNMIVYSKPQEFSIISTMEEQEKRFLPYHFVKIHRSYLVNLQYIHQIKGNDIIMDNAPDRTLPISRRYRADVINQHASYISMALKEMG